MQQRIEKFWPQNFSCEKKETVGLLHLQILIAPDSMSRQAGSKRQTERVPRTTRL